MIEVWLIEECSLVVEEEHRGPIVPGRTESGSKGWVDSRLFSGYVDGGVVLEVEIGSVNFLNDLIEHVEPRVEVSVGGTEDFLIGKLVEVVDVSRAHKIGFRDNLLVDHIHDHIDNDEGH